jgi:hypothetical protein
MRARVLGVTGVLTLLTASTPGAVFAAPALPAGKSKVLYRASFATTKLKGWDTQGTSWHVSKKGIVQFTGSKTGEGLLVAPFSTAGLKDFRVTASIAAGGKIDLTLNPFFGVFARRSGPGTKVDGGSFFSAIAQSCITRAGFRCRPVLATTRTASTCTGPISPWRSMA